MSGLSGRPRQLTVRSTTGNERLIIWVEDDGPSLGATDQERMFEPFFTTKTHGTGMGLSICRSILQAHGGSIRIVARTPFGAAFEISLPRAAQGAAAAAPGS